MYPLLFQANLLLGRHSMPGEGWLSIPGMAQLLVGLVRLGGDANCQQKI